MDTNKALQKLLNGTALKEEIGLFKQALASGEISIGRVGVSNSLSDYVANSC